MFGYKLKMLSKYYLKLKCCKVNEAHQNRIIDILTGYIGNIT